MTNKGRILVIEDNKDHINLINQLNNKYKFTIDIGHNLHDFIELTSNGTYFDLILCDIDLDYQLEGLDILDYYKKQELKGDIYAYTLSSENEVLFLEKGFKKVIKKDLNNLNGIFLELFNQKNGKLQEKQDSIFIAEKI